MTDARRRELERQADAESEARLLVEAVRSGELAQADLDLAADLGDPRAALATGRTARPLLEVCAEVQGERLVAAACALAETALPAWTLAWASEPRDPVARLVEALRSLRDDGAPIGHEVTSEAREAVEDLERLPSLAAFVVVLAAEAVTDASSRQAFSRGVSLARGILGEAGVRWALARAVLPARPALPSPIAAGAPLDEVELLAARLASGALSLERLELARGLGHGAASDALGLPREDPFGLAWLARLDPDSTLTREVVVRALVALAPGRERGSDAGRALTAAIEWALDPGEPTAVEARRAGLALDPTAAEPSADFLDAFFPPLPPALAREAALACGAPPRTALEALVSRRPALREHIGMIRHELVPWLLGYRDALAPEWSFQDRWT